MIRDIGRQRELSAECRIGYESYPKMRQTALEGGSASKLRATTMAHMESEVATVGRSSESESWFALYVKSRHEKNVSAILRGKGFAEFVPLYRRRTPSRTYELPLFPGYVFCRFNAEHRLPVLAVPGVFYVVGFAGTAAPVSTEEIAALQLVVRSGLPREPWPELPAGKKVVVAAGPLEGIEGIVMSYKNRSRLLISVALLQRSVSVEVDRSWLQ
jgi:transcription antitermination factor NusG